MKFFRVLVGAFVYFCVATCIAQFVGLGMLWWKGTLQDGRALRMLASLQGVDLSQMALDLDRASRPRTEEQAAYQDVVDARVKASLDLDLRELSLDKAVSELASLESSVKTEKERYTKMKDALDARLKEIEDGVRAPALTEVQRTLEVMQPRQAKDQLLKMIEDDGMPDVVALMKALSAEKRKKIVAEFKSGDEPEKLYEILREIRKGEPDASFIRDARDQIKKFNAEKSPGTDTLGAR